MKALSSLAKFIGQYQDWLSLVKNYGLKWSARNGDDVIIARLCKTSNASEIYEWVKNLKSVFPEFRDFIDLLSISGMRFTETVLSYNLIVKMSKKEKLHEYYDAQKGILEHYRFKEVFLRRTKKVFISFAPRELIERISENKILTEDAIRNKVKRRGIPRRFSDTRELFGTLATKYLTDTETDFLQGRVSTVFLKHYFNPLLLDNLKTRAFRVIDEITNQIC